MRAEIFEQPAVLARLLAEAAPIVEGVARAAKRCRFAMLAARGSSDNASTYGKYLLEGVAGVPTALAAPSLFTLYATPPRIGDALVVGVSQSGAAADVIAVLDEARRQGGVTLAITNTTESPITKAAEFVILLNAGLEKALAATKTVTGQCLAYAMLAAEISSDVSLKLMLRVTPEAVRNVLEQDEAIRAIAANYEQVGNIFVIGRGYTYSAAEEIALKLKETCFISAEAFSAADFLHGPLATIEPGDDVMMLLANDASLRTNVEFIERVLSRGARILIFATQDAMDDENVAGLLSRAHGEQLLVLKLSEMPVILSNIAFIAAGQLFAMHLSVLKGHNPDVSRGVTKVTVTR
jgi:glucosamine--fructose-6-phosphate aminotransferase (isomerizing)